MGFTLPKPFGVNETDWRFKETKDALAKVKKHLSYKGLKVPLSCLARKPGLKAVTELNETGKIIKLGRWFYVRTDGYGVLHAHALLKSESILRRHEIAYLKRYVRKIIGAEGSGSIYLRPVIDVAGYNLYIAENVLKTKRTADMYHARLINKSQDIKNISQLFPPCESPQNGSISGFKVATLKRISFITKTFTTKQAGLIANILKYMKQQSKELSLPPPPCILPT